ncbi:arylacetamide deacetylase-like 3 [Gracilinanus agilis]|uniref:arylacetamide deacetylase-like 3 n=1 Tax=Gracilinanus agilis TaxID=191870 RepID=UPI001CFC6A42|nr:arylacetamide deacetylase-like 3 [Gracilinanus agilis]
MMNWLLLLLQLGCLFNLGIGLFVIFVHFCRTDIPAGISHKTKFHVLHLSYLLVITWGMIFEKLGICSMPKVVRFLQELVPEKNYPDVVVINQHYGTLPVRLYMPKAPFTKSRCGIIFFHGGGGIFGNLKIYNGLCSYLSKECDSVVLTVSYRKLPEHKYFALFDDCMNATIRFLKNLEIYGVDPSRVIICGDSIGGTGATIICQNLITQPDLPKIRAQVMIYPFIQGCNFQLPSHQQNKNVPMLTRDLAIFCFFQHLDIHPIWKTAVQNGAHVPPEIWENFEKRLSVHNLPKRFIENGFQPMPLDPFNENAYMETKRILSTTISPLLADNYIIAQLPQTLLVSCEFDIFRDDALLYKKTLEDHGVPVSWHHMEDGFHGILVTFDTILAFPCALKIMNIIVNFVKDL